MDIVETLSVKIPKKELEAFDEAVKKSERFLNRSDAIRHLIRKFIEEQNVTPRSVVGVGGKNKKEAEADG